MMDRVARLLTGGMVGLALACLVALPGIAQVAPSVPFAPGGGGGGGLTPATADATYLRLDTANDPLTGPLEIDASLDARDGIYNQSTSTGGQIALSDTEGVRTVSGLWTSGVPSGGSAHHFSTTTTYGSGNLLQVSNNGTNVVNVTPTSLNVATTSGITFTGGRVTLTENGGYVSQTNSSVAWVRQAQASVGDVRIAGYEDAPGEIGVRIGSIRSDGENGDTGTLASFCTDCDGTPAEKASVDGAGRFYGGDGTAAAPSFSFRGDPNSGLYNAATDTVGMAANGSFVQTWATTSTIFRTDADPNTDDTYSLGSRVLAYAELGVNDLQFSDSYIKTDLSTGTPTCAAGTEGLQIYVRDSDFGAGPKNGLCLCTTTTGTGGTFTWDAITSGATAACADLP